MTVCSQRYNMKNIGVKYTMRKILALTVLFVTMTVFTAYCTELIDLQTDAYGYELLTTGIQPLQGTGKIMYEWKFNEEWLDGWTPMNSLGELSVKNATAFMMVTGFDPQFVSPGVNFKGSKGQIIEVNMAATQGTHISIYWTSNEERRWSEDQRWDIDIVADGEFRTYTSYIDCENWSKRTIRQIRVDLEPANVEGAEFAVDDIRIIDAGMTVDLNATVSKGLIHPGEQFDLIVRIHNYGSVDLEDLLVDLDYPDTFHIMESPGSSFQILAGEQIQDQDSHELTMNACSNLQS
jgi:hypothetical protein